MTELIEKLRKSGNKLLESEANDIAMWSKLRHTKRDLEIFLDNNIAEISFKKMNGDDDIIVCTSNTSLIKCMSMKKKKDKVNASHLKSKGIKTRDSLTINTWDLEQNKMKTIPLSSWQILNFITISEQNILVLDELVNDVLNNGRVTRKDNSRK